MKENILIEAFFNYDKSSFEKKLEFLQKIENASAKFYGRDARTVRYVGHKDDYLMQNFHNKLEENGSLRVRILGYFDSTDPKYINLKYAFEDYLTDACSVLHEGMHALIYDYFYRNLNLKVFTKFNPNELLRQKINKDRIIYAINQNENCELLGDFFSIAYLEEFFCNEEENLFVLNNILESLESSKEFSDLMGLYSYFIEHGACLGKYKENLERHFGVRFEDFVSYAIVSTSENKNFPQFKTKRGTVKTIENESLQQHYAKQIKLAGDIGVISEKSPSDQSVLYAMRKEYMKNIVDFAKLAKNGGIIKE